jgi:hypothetical protein
MGSDRTAEFMQNARIHQEGAQHALEVKDIGHWCLGAVVNMDSPRLVAAAVAVLKLHRPIYGDSVGCAAGGCTWSWPCPTIQAITRELTGAQPGEDGKHEQA